MVHIWLDEGKMDLILLFRVLLIFFLFLFHLSELKYCFKILVIKGLNQYESKVFCLFWCLFFRGVLYYVFQAFMAGFSPLEVMLGGYFFLGILSLVLILKQGLQKWRSIPWTQWRQAIFYALIVNVVYYFSLINGLRWSNASVIALLMGVSPITLSFYGNWLQKEYSYRQLAVPTLLIGCGIVCVNWEAMTLLSGPASWGYLFGLSCGILALLAWNWYAVSNTQFLKENPSLSSCDWSIMIGIGTFVWVLAILPLFLASSSAEDLQKFYDFGPTLYYFLMGCLIMGAVCAWLGSYFWNLGSQTLPIALAGQLTIFETIFGILFFYLLKHSFPTFLELMGIVATLTGVCVSLHLFRKPARSTPQLLYAEPEPLIGM